MANAVHIRVAENGASFISEWRASNPEETLDLSGEDLSSKLRDADLRGADLSHSNLSGSSLDGLDLSHARFERADLSGSRFDGTCLQAAILKHADLTRATGRRTDFTSADLSSATLSSAHFPEAVFRQVNLFLASLADADFAEADLREADLTGARAEKAGFVRAKAHYATFCRTLLIRATLKDADVSYADFSFAKLDGADLGGAVMRGCCLNKAMFPGARFGRTVLDKVERFESAIGLEKAHVSRNASALGTDELPWDQVRRRDRWLGWDKIRTIGNLPLFGASYATLGGVLAFLYCLDFYNRNLDVLQEWADDHSDVIAAVISRLNPLPVPGNMLLLFLSVLSLALASTVYLLACPSRVKEFSLARWCDEFGSARINYTPLCWKYFVPRLISMVGYVIGGLCLLYVLGEKVLSAIVLLWRYAGVAPT